MHKKYAFEHIYAIFSGILDDEEVQATLQELREVAIDVQRQLDEAQVTEQEIVLSRQQYFPVSIKTHVSDIILCR